MTRRAETYVLFALMAGIFLSFATAARAKTCRVEGVITHTGNVRDVLATPNSLWVASEGGIEEFDRRSHALRKKYTHLDGLLSPQVTGLSRGSRGALIAHADGATCHLRGERFVCEQSTLQPSSEGLSFAYHQGHRVTAQTKLNEGPLIGTAGGGARIGTHRLGSSELPDRHITSLALFGGRIWVGTFNGGLARQQDSGRFQPVDGPGRLINALLAGPSHLFVGTSDGLYRTKDGTAFERVSIVEDAVVGLAFDGTSVWATTPGAIYRVRDRKGPPSDVWWLPGGSRSLQKVSAVPGTVWFGTEDRGAIAMKVGPRTVSKDKPFSVFDRGRGMPSSWSLAVAARPDGSAWMTTLREGVTFISKEGQARSVSTGLSEWGLSALVDGAGVWIGTQDGAAYLSDRDAPPQRVTRLPDERVHAFLKDPRSGGRLWLGTENGLAWCRPD